MEALGSHRGGRERGGKGGMKARRLCRARDLNAGEGSLDLPCFGDGRAMRAGCTRGLSWPRCLRVRVVNDENPLLIRKPSWQDIDAVIQIHQRGQPGVSSSHEPLRSIPAANEEWKATNPGSKLMHGVLWLYIGRHSGSAKATGPAQRQLRSSIAKSSQ